MLPALLAVLAAAPPSVRYLENKDGVLRVLEHVRGAKADVELARASQKCPVERSAWSAKADRVLVTSQCALVLLELDRKGAKTFPAPDKNGVRRTQLEFATDGAVLAFVEYTSQEEVKAFEWKKNAWVEIEKGTPADGLDSIDGLAFHDMKSRQRLGDRPASLNALVAPGGASADPEREPTGAELSALPRQTEEGFQWKVYGTAEQQWAGTIAGTDACFLFPPIAVRVGKAWKLVLDKGECVRSLRRGGTLLLDGDTAVLVDFATGARDEIKTGFHHVLLGEGTNFVQ